MGFSFAVVGRACAGLVGAVAAASAMAALPTPPVDGLIVKLKGAPAHERMAALSAAARSSETQRLQQVLQAARMTEVRMQPAGRAAQHFSFGRHLPVAEALALAERLRSQPEVEWVELNARERLLQAAPVVPNDLYYDYRSPTDTGQWWLRPPGEALGGWPISSGAPGVQGAWAVTTGRASAVVAVLDTGTTNHPDLTGRFLTGYDFVSDVAYANDGNGRDPDPSDPGDWVSQAEADTDPLYATCTVQDSSWHGTVISGVVAAATDNSVGVAGVNWNGRVLPVRVAGKCGASVLDITDGMRWAAGLHVNNVPDNANPARIVNISFGGSAPCGNLYQNTIDELASRGVVVVAAAGNEQGAVTRPASCSGVVGVAALARDGLKAGYSNFGPRVVISTLGGDPDVDDGIFTVSNDGTQSAATATYGSVYGTSFAAPIVSGVVSLMLSANPNLSVPQIISGLQVTARPHVQSTSTPFCSSNNSGACVCTTSTCGAGVLDAERAVRYAAGAPLDPGRGDSGGGGGGGGALSWPWLIGLALGVAALARVSGSRRANRKRLAE